MKSPCSNVCRRRSQAFQCPGPLTGKGSGSTGQAQSQYSASTGTCLQKGPRCPFLILRILPVTDGSGRCWSAGFCKASLLGKVQSLLPGISKASCLRGTNKLPWETSFCWLTREICCFLREALELTISARTFLYLALVGLSSETSCFLKA